MMCFFETVFPYKISHNVSNTKPINNSSQIVHFASENFDSQTETVLETPLSSSLNFSQNHDHSHSDSFQNNFSLSLNTH